MRERDPSLPNIENDRRRMMKRYPSQLWYLFDSEIEVVVKESIPQSSHLLSSRFELQRHVCERLGEHSMFLSGFIEVNKIISEEVKKHIENSGTTSPLGKVHLWTNGLQCKIVSSSSSLFESVAKAASNS